MPARRTFLLASFSAACSIVGPELDIDDSGQGGMVPPPVSDASWDSGADGSGSSDSDAPLVDGTSPEATVPAPRPCRVTGRDAALCATFDEDPFEKGFVSRTEQGGAVLAADGSMWRSAPRSLVVTVPPSAANAAAYLKGVIARPTTTITMAASIFPSNVVDVTTAFQLEFGPDELKLRVGNPPEFRETIVGNVDQVSSVELPPLPDRRWTRVTMTLTLTATSSSATILYDDRIVLANRPVRAHAHRGQVELKVGSVTVVSTSAVSAFQLHFDDVVVDHD